jgi:tRNA splicing endonuclease
MAMAGANNTTATEQVTASKTTVNLANSKKTSVEWTARNGQTYTVYVSRNGKAFVVRTSAKTGNEYRYYNLPEDIKQQAINSVTNHK